MVERDQTEAQSTFGSLWQEFLASDQEKKNQLAFKLWADPDLKLGPEAKETISAFLFQFSPTDRESLTINCQWSLLLCLQHLPSPKTIELADRYLGAGEPHLVATAAQIIGNGKDLLTPEEKRGYSKKIREAIDDLGEYDITGPIVPIVVDFGGSETVNWLCEILKHQAIVRGASEAFALGMDLSPGKVVEALFFQLRNTRPDFWHGKAWVIQHLIYASEAIDDPRDLSFLADSIVEVASLEGNEFNMRYPRETVIETVLREEEAVRGILTKLQESDSKKAILDLLGKEEGN